MTPAPKKPSPNSPATDRDHPTHPNRPHPQPALPNRDHTPLPTRVQTALPPTVGFGLFEGAAEGGLAGRCEGVGGQQLLELGDLGMAGRLAAMFEQPFG